MRSLFLVVLKQEMSNYLMLITEDLNTSYVPVFFENILLFVAAFVTYFYSQLWKQVRTNDILSGIFRGIDSWDSTQRFSVLQIVSKKNRISSISSISQMLKL